MAPNNTIRYSSNASSPISNRVINSAINNFGRHVERSFDFDPEIAEEIKSTVRDINGMSSILQTGVTKRSFPIVMFTIGILLDLFALADVSGVTYLIRLILNVFFLVALMFYFAGRIDGSFVSDSRFVVKQTSNLINTQIARKIRAKLIKKIRKKVTNKIFKKFLLGFILRIIPILAILASNGLFIILAYNYEKKIVRAYVRLIQGTAEIMRKVQKIHARGNRTR